MNNKLQELQPSASVMLIAKAKEMQKKDPSIIGLAGGEPDFCTPSKITEAAINALKSGDTHYRIGPGLPSLRIAIANKLKRENSINCNENQIIITPGGKNAIFLAISSVLNNGDEAIILDPAWVSYEPMIIAAGGKPTHIKLNYLTNYFISEEQLEAAITERTRLIIINYPNNPTGRVLHYKEACVLEAVLLRHPKVYLLSDEIYEKIVYDDNKSISIGSFSSIANRVITVNGFSKSYAMTGWRIGYIQANKEVIDIAYKLYQHSLTCMSGFIQQGAIEAFNCNEEAKTMVEVYKQRRDVFCSIINTIPGVYCSVPEGAFYAWVQFNYKGMNSTEIANLLLEKARVVGVPGIAYGEDQIAYVRFSFANKTEDVIEAANRIKNAIDN